MRIRQRERLCWKGSGGFAVNHQLGDDLMPRQLRQVFRRVKLAKLAREESRIFSPYREAQQVARIAEDRGAYFLWHLGDVLVG